MVFTDFRKNVPRLIVRTGKNSSDLLVRTGIEILHCPVFESKYPEVQICFITLNT